MPLLSAAALTLALAALALTAVAWARRLGARGPLVPLAAAPLAASVAAIETLLLGLIGLGGSGVALTAAAVATWLAAGRPLPPLPRPRVPSPFGGLLIGAGLAWLAWLVLHPWLAIDPLTYHLPESIIWIQHGSPGSVETLQYEFPQGNYPVTNELLVAWLMGISRGFGAAILWTPALALLALGAGWTVLKQLRADRAVGAWALAAVLLSPIALTQVIGPHTDLPALAWLWCAAALALATRAHPGLLIPALAAAGLALGTKTTPAPLILLGALWIAWTLRAHRRRLVPPLVIGGLLALGAGGVWYARNLIVHGSPLYPFMAAPWGDPMPEFLSRLDATFLSRPAATLERNGAAYIDAVAGGWVVLWAGLLAAPVLARTRHSRRARALSAAAAVGLLAWTVAPFTGASPDATRDVSATTVRYLLPTIGVAALALALAARGASNTVRAVLVAVLAGACAWSLYSASRLSVVAIPSAATLLAGAVAGLLCVLAVRHLRPPAWLAAGRTQLAAGLAGLTALTLIAGNGFIARQATAPFLPSSGVIAWAAKQPRFMQGDFPVAFAPQLLAPLAGERLSHPIELIGRRESCRSVRRRAAAGWVVIGTFPLADRRLPFSAPGCLRGLKPLYDDGVYAVFGPAQTATRSKAAAGSPVSRKSPGAISAADG